MDELDIENTENITSAINAIQANIEEEVNETEFTEELLLEQQLNDKVLREARTWIQNG